jgi:hypothetical protein
MYNDCIIGVDEIKKLILFLIFSFHILANVDLSAGAAARSYPAIGFETFAEFGYNQLIYGNAPGKGILYGLLRPSIRAASSAVINSYDLKLEFYPISILGIAIGHQNIRSDFDEFPFYDCDEIRCTGELKKDYAHIRAVLGYGPIVAIGMVEESRNIYDDPDNEELPVAEFRFAIRARNDFDANTRSQYILGYRTENKNMFALITEYVYFKESRQYNKMNLMAFQSKGKNSNITYGIGSFEATDQAQGLIGVFQYIYRFSPSFKLF